MKFTVKGLIFLGLKKGISKKTQKEFCILSMLTSDNNVIHCFAENKINVDLKKFDKVEVDFRLSFGKGYISQYKLTVIDIRKIG